MNVLHNSSNAIKVFGWSSWYLKFFISDSSTTFQTIPEGYTKRTTSVLLTHATHGKVTVRHRNMKWSWRKPNFSLVSSFCYWYWRKEMNSSNDSTLYSVCTCVVCILYLMGWCVCASWMDGNGFRFGFVGSGFFLIHLFRLSYVFSLPFKFCTTSHIIIYNTRSNLNFSCLTIFSVSVLYSKWTL